MTEKERETGGGGVQRKRMSVTGRPLVGRPWHLGERKKSETRITPTYLAGGRSSPMRHRMRAAHAPKDIGGEAE